MSQLYTFLPGSR